MTYPNEVIKIGYNNPSVTAAIKNRLNVLGFGPLTPTISNIGTETVKKIKAFQKSRNLIQDGEVGELTWDRLFDVQKLQSLSALVLTVINIAKGYLNVREKTGHNDGVDVERFQKLTGNSKGDSWCMSFIFTLFFEACKLLNRAIPVPRTGGVLECLRQAKAQGCIITNDPQPGDQGIMDFGGGHGHTFLVTERNGIRVYTIEGNTSADPSYAGEDRDGNGVFERNRPISSVKCFIRYI